MATISIKCSHCGGELVFEPSSQNYICAYCGSAFSQTELDSLLASEQGQPDPVEEQPRNGIEGALYHCPSCGAEIVTDATTAATFCYYCHNPVVLTGRISGAYLPDRIIPFKISREKATADFLDYVGRKRYVPKAFFNARQIEKLTGVYYPYWLYDAEVAGDLTAEATKVKVWRMGDTEYTQTSVYHVERAGTANIRDLTRNALKKTAGELVEKVQPYSLEEAKPFSMGYLSGFMAEKRDLEKDQFTAQLRDEAGKYASQLMQGSASGYASFRVVHADYVPEKENFAYVLLPVWVLTYRSVAGKMYYYAMNGQTGSVAGELPIDWKKLLLHSVLLGLLVMAVMLGLSYFVF